MHMDAHPLPDLEPILTHAHLLATQLRHLRLFFASLRSQKKESSARRSLCLGRTGRCSKSGGFSKPVEPKKWSFPTGCKIRCQVYRGPCEVAVRVDGWKPSDFADSQWFFLGKKWVSSEETLLNAMKYLKNRYFQYVFWLIDQNFAVPLCVRIILGDVAMHRCSYEYHIDHVCHGAQVCKLTGTTSSKLVVLMHLGGTGHWKRIPSGYHCAAKSGYGKWSNPIEFSVGIVWQGQSFWNLRCSQNQELNLQESPSHDPPNEATGLAGPRSEIVNFVAALRCADGRWLGRKFLEDVPVVTLYPRNRYPPRISPKKPNGQSTSWSQEVVKTPWQKEIKVTLVKHVDPMMII